MAELLTIGELARRSGLTASALRFYDRERVLVPAEVDPVSGYRRYALEQVREARLVAHLRRVGMPLGELALILGLRRGGEVEAARDVVRAHEDRLEEGLRDARREIASGLELLSHADEFAASRAETAPLLTFDAGHLGEALSAVSFAVAKGRPAADDELGVLHGVLLQVFDGQAHLVATDRYRLAVAPLSAEMQVGTVARCVLPLAWLEELAAHGADCRVDLALGAENATGQITNTAGDSTLIESPYVPGQFPDHHGILDVSSALSAQGVRADRIADQLRVRDDGGGDRDWVEMIIGDGELSLVATETASEKSEQEADADSLDGGGAAVRVNRKFLREALSAVRGTPTLALDGPISPLAIRGELGGLSILMPMRAEP